VRCPSSPLPLAIFAARSLVWEVEDGSLDGDVLDLSILEDWLYLWCVRCWRFRRRGWGLLFRWLWSGGVEPRGLSGLEMVN
jgi:hypothetical protein